MQPICSLLAQAPPSPCLNAFSGHESGFISHMKPTRRAEELMPSGQPTRKGADEQIPQLPSPWSDNANVHLHSLSEGPREIEPSFPQWPPAHKAPLLTFLPSLSLTSPLPYLALQITSLKGSCTTCTQILSKCLSTSGRQKLDHPDLIGQANELEFIL